MHVLIATTGALSPEPVVDFTRHLLGTQGRVTITTVIEVPRDFLDSLDADDWHPLADDEPDAGDGVVDGTDPATAISNAAGDLRVDVVVLCATRQIFDRDAWESVSARVMVESGKPVLVLPAPPKEEPDREEEV